MTGKTCIICGKPSGNYLFCFSCNKLKDEGKIVKCETCKKWHLTDKPCDCVSSKSSAPRSTQTHTESTPTEKEQSGELTCLICGEPSNGQHLCKSCYYKYKNKTILVEIRNGKEYSLLNEEYEGKYGCEDGHIVKSKTEVIIDNYFYTHQIKHAYEIPVYMVDEKGERVELHPDFYLPDYDVYLEHWGYGDENKRYISAKEYKIKLYNLNHKTVICTYEKDVDGMSAILDFKLSHFEKGKVNSQ